MGKRINWAGVSGLFLSDAEVAEARHALALARSMIRSGEKETESRPRHSTVVSSPSARREVAVPTAAEPPKEWDVVVEVTVRVKAADYGAIARVLENRDEGGTPRPLGSTGPVHERGWQDLFYQLPDEQEVLGHLAFNAVLNGVEDVSRLDGWGDLPAGSVTMELNRNSFSVAEVR